MSAKKRDFDENTRVKIPATIHFLRLGYDYQSMKTADIDFNTKIFVNRFKPALEKINHRKFTNEEIETLVEKIYTLMRNNDMGRSFYIRLSSTKEDVRLIDFDKIENNDFAVVDELSYDIEKDTKKGSFRPDINILINGIPLAFLEVKKPDNPGGIQEEFKRMVNNRLKNPAYQKFFNMIQFISFSNNMEYENEDSDDRAMIKAGSFYSTPNGMKTTFSFFREDEKGYLENYPFQQLNDEGNRKIIDDLGYDEAVYDTPEFQTNMSVDTPCNRFVTSMFDKERFLFIIHYGILYLNNITPERHIIRYPQFFAARALLKRLDKGQKRGIIWHTQGSGKTELAVYCNRILQDYYAKKNIVPRFFFVVDRLELLNQDNTEFTNRHLTVTNVQNKAEFSNELKKNLPKVENGDIGEFVVVNIQKFDENHIPKAENVYHSNIQRVFFIDEAHRSYALNGTYFRNLIQCDENAVFVALTGTPLLSKRERSNLKFGDYIHKYFYDKSIADGYTLRIKKEKIDTVARTNLKRDLEMENPNLDSKEVYESDDYINYLGTFITNDFTNFRWINGDLTIGGMIVCRSNPQAVKLHKWFKRHGKLTTGLVITDNGDAKQAEANRHNQKEFKEEGRPDILIVEYMLTTGYDVSRLKKMYLLRGPHAQNLLQTISRVNRPYKSPTGHVYHYGYITDFVDITKEYDRTLNDYLKELEQDMTIPGEEGNNGINLDGLVIDTDIIRKRYEEYKKKLDDYASEDNLELFTEKIHRYNEDSLQKIKRYLNGIKDCYREFKLSNDTKDMSDIDIKKINAKLKLTQEHINFLKLKEVPNETMMVLSNEEIVKIVYDFIKTSISILNLGDFIPEVNFDNDHYKKFSDTLIDVKHSLDKNRNPHDIKLVKLNEALKQLFRKLNIKSIDELDNLTEELKKLKEQADAINAENNRLASLYDNNFALVKTYQDILEDHPEFNNNDVEKAIKIIYQVIKGNIDSEILIVQGRQGFINEVNKKAAMPLLKAGLYKNLKLGSWIDSLLSNLYTNLQIYR